MKDASPAARFWAEFRESKVAVAALALVVALVGVALLAPLIAPQDPYDLAKLALMDARRPPGYVGSGGVGETTEWNRKTPRGQFSFTYAFGILPNPGTELSYTQVDDTYYWVDDVNSRYYNQFVTTKTTPKAWNFPADAFLFRKTR